MSGSVVTVGTQAVSAIFNLSVPPWVFWPIGFVCFFVAGYRAWKKQYLARLSAETKRNLDAERRAELQEPLAEFTAKDRLLIRRLLFSGRTENELRELLTSEGYQGAGDEGVALSRRFPYWERRGIDGRWHVQDAVRHILEELLADAQQGARA